MPKIFGKVTLVNRQTQLSGAPILGNVVCMHCGNSWKAQSYEIRDLQRRLKITCPYCRLTKERTPGDPISPKHPEFVISEDTFNVPFNDLIHPVKYLDTPVKIINKTCGHTFSIKSRDLEDFAENPKCLKCFPNHKYSGVYKEQLKQTPETPSKTVVKKPEAITQLKQTPKEPFNTPKKSIRQETSLVKPIDCPKPTLKENDVKPVKSAEAKVYEDILQKLHLRINQVIGYNVIKDVDVANGSCVFQCVKCGTEWSASVKQLVNKGTRDMALKCPSCEGLNSKANADKLTLEYCGKVFNGLRITRIYKSNSKMLCDVECVESCVIIRNDDGSYSKHVRHHEEGIILGEVINCRKFCEKCGKGRIIGGNRLFREIKCYKFRDILANSGIGIMGVGDNKDTKTPQNLTLGTMYTDSGSICDYCVNKSRCKDAYGIQNRFDFIRNMADMTDNIKTVNQSVTAQYPSIYSTDIDGANVVKPELGKGIIVYRDAYRGRDGKLYKFCKCVQHGTEMLLNEAEIGVFKHAQCIGESKSEYMRFYPIKPMYLLTKLEKKK